jgi:competence protein ComEC
MQKVIGKVKEQGIWYVLAGMALVTVLIWYAVFTESRGNVLTVAFLDVGQGDAIYIEAPNGNQVLIDGGANANVLRELSRVMPFYDRSIDIVIATHPDTDHIGGLSDVLERFDVNYIFQSGVEGDSNTYNSFVRFIEREVESGAQRVLARRGQIIVLDEGVELHILFPDRDVSDIESNAGSIITQLVYGETEFMLTGDSPQAIEKYLVNVDGANLRSDVLKVGHHGSNTSSAESFIAAVLPTYAVISAGTDNRYGHPHREVLELFELLESEIFSTFESGTIIFESNGVSVRKVK